MRDLPPSVSDGVFDQYGRSPATQLKSYPSESIQVPLIIMLLETENVSFYRCCDRFSGKDDQNLLNPGSNIRKITRGDLLRHNAHLFTLNIYRLFSQSLTYHRAEQTDDLISQVSHDDPRSKSVTSVLPASIKKTAPIR